MKNIYIQNKLVFILGICTALFGLNNLSAFAQQRKPTPAEIQQAKTSLRQQVQSFEKGNSVYSLKDHRTSEQKQNRDRLVNAWKSVQPEVAPFLGSWSGYETAWSIYPSNTKGKVCIVRSELGDISVDTGTLIADSIYTQDGKIFVKDGNYSGIGKIENNRFVQINDVPLNSPRALTEPHLSKNIDGFSPSHEQLKPYVDAGCTASAPERNQSKQTALESLPDGNYIYGQLPYKEIMGAYYWTFSKAGDVVTGMRYMLHTDDETCFQGTVRNDEVLNATSIYTIIGPPSRDQITQNLKMDFSNLYYVEKPSKYLTETIDKCKHKILSNVPQKQLSLVSSNYKEISPDLEIPTYVQFGSLEFIKGEEGFYILRHTNNKRCVGIDRKVNKLATAHCGYDNFNMWNLIPILSENGDKFLYVINLRGSRYCLSRDSSLTSCNNLGLLMAPSLN